MRLFNMTVTIVFPALDNLVAYLREKDQQKIDDLSSKVNELAERLRKSNQDLADAVQANPNS